METENSKFQNELLELHKQLFEIIKTLNSINLEWATLLKEVKVTVKRL